MMRKQTVVILIGSMMAILSVILWLDLIGVTINNRHFLLHELYGYRDGIELSVPAVFTEGYLFSECFSYDLVDDFGIVDIADRNVTLDGRYSCDMDRLYEMVGEWNRKCVKSVDAYIDIDTMTVVQEQYGTEIDFGKLSGYLQEHVSGQSFITPVSLSDFYIEPLLRAADLSSRLRFYESYREWHAGYAGADVVITVPDSAVAIDSHGSISVDASFLDGCMDMLSVFDTKGGIHSFVTHDGRTIAVNGGTYGSVVDMDAEIQELKRLFLSKVSVDNRHPVYEEYMPDDPDTYIEVSLSEQHVWFYENGRVVMDSDCVSGTDGTKRQTPSGFWYLDIVEKNRILRPSGSASGSFVNRWMRFTPDGCGLHDAIWRNRFGSSIYKTNGSHGCVNLPKAFAYDLYEHACYGMPVVVY